MKFGVREICDVVLKATANQKIGDKIFYKDEPVIYFDTLKTSSMEGASTTVYAQGGKGNARLMAWEGERTLTFTMEDALISPAGFAILSGAGLINADADNQIITHTTQMAKVSDGGTIQLEYEPYEETDGDWIYVMKVDLNGNPNSEPYIYTKTDDPTVIKLKHSEENVSEPPSSDDKMVLVDYYVSRPSGAYQIDITPDKFGGYYYLEASTLFRDQDGVDMPAEFIIPKCKIQSNFTFTMSSSGDPSTFTFTIDAFPGYTRFGNEKVLASIQVVNEKTNTGNALTRQSTAANLTHEVNADGTIIAKDSGKGAKALLG